MGRKGVESTLHSDCIQGRKKIIMLGIDVAKDTLACTLLDPQTRKTLWRKTIANTPAGIQSLLHCSPAEAPWVLEPTGRYSTPVAALARQADRNVLLAPPRQAKSFLRSIQCRAKTDKLDSEGLALFALSQALAPYPLKTPIQEQIDQLLLARRGMARAAASLGQQSKELPHAKEPLQKALTELKAQIKVLDKEIAALTTHPELAAAARLRQVPGIGPVTAAALASRLAGKQFSRPDKLVAYIGLDIGVQQSGRKKGERGLTKQGDAELRRLLFLCASSSLLCKDTGFKDQYEREKAKGLPSTAALCAVARKMAKVCWSIVAHGTQYEAARVYLQPKNQQSQEKKSQENPSKPLQPLDNEP